MRKPRSDSKLMTLREEHQAKLADWLLSGMSYADARELVEKEFGVRVPLGSFTSFWDQVCVPHYLRRRSQAVETADALAEAATAQAGRFDQATIDALKQRAFELAISPHANPKDVKSLFMLVLKSRDQEIDQAELALAQAKYQRETCETFIKWVADEQAKAIATGSQSNTEKIERLGQLMFGEDWQQ
ncbi:MAG: hypothetical protein AB9869_01205 [Verrucomicrobiia bacterium]